MKRRLHESNDSRYLTIDQLAVQLNVGTTTARKIAVKSGAVRKILGTTRVDMDVIDTYIANECAAGG